MFLFADGGIQWTTGDNAGGVDGPGGDEALAGINAGNGFSSITVPDIINIDQTSNIEIPGIWVYQVRTGMSFTFEVSLV